MLTLCAPCTINTVRITPLARFDGALNRRRSTPAWQQGRVAVDAAQTRNIQHHLRQDHACACKAPSNWPSAWGAKWSCCVPVKWPGSNGSTATAQDRHPLAGDTCHQPLPVRREYPALVKSHRSRPASARATPGPTAPAGDSPCPVHHRRTRRQIGRAHV